MLPHAAAAMAAFLFVQSQPQVEEYYRSIVGIGGFVMVADGFDTFAYALHRKLVREVAGR